MARRTPPPTHNALGALVRCHAAQHLPEPLDHRVVGSVPAPPPSLTVSLAAATTALPPPSASTQRNTKRHHNHHTYAPAVTGLALQHVQVDLRAASHQDLQLLPREQAERGHGHDAADAAADGGDLQVELVQAVVHRHLHVALAVGKGDACGAAASHQLNLLAGARVAHEEDVAERGTEVRLVGDRLVALAVHGVRLGSRTTHHNAASGANLAHTRTTGTTAGSTHTPSPRHNRGCVASPGHTCRWRRRPAR